MTAAISAQRCLGEAGRYAELCQQHVRAWARLWERCAIDLTGNTEELRLVRLHLLHLLQTISPHTAELDAGVPARGLNGEAYRGHVFWDALFVARCPACGCRRWRDRCWTIGTDDYPRPAERRTGRATLARCIPGSRAATEAK